MSIDKDLIAYLLFLAALVGSIVYLFTIAAEKQQKKNCIKAQKYEQRYPQYERDQEYTNYCIKSFGINIKQGLQDRN